MMYDLCGHCMGRLGELPCDCQEAMRERRERREWHDTRLDEMDERLSRLETLIISIRDELLGADK